MGLLERVLGGVDVAEDPRQGGQDRPAVGAERGLDGGPGGVQPSISITRWTSMAPPVETGMAAATASAPSRPGVART